jgi:hypothetical protein
VAELGAAERQRMRTTLGVLAAGYAVTFLVVVLLHVGVEIPLGFAVLEEPRRPVAVLVEGVAGLLLGLGALAVLARRTWAWAAVTGAHAVALAGVGWGMVAVAAGRGPHTPAQRHLPPSHGGAVGRYPAPAAHPPGANLAGTGAQVSTRERDRSQRCGARSPS